MNTLLICKIIGFIIITSITIYIWFLDKKKAKNNDALYIILLILNAAIIFAIDVIKDYYDNKNKIASDVKINETLSNQISYSQYSLNDKFPEGYSVFYRSGKFGNKIGVLKTNKINERDLKTNFADSANYKITERCIELNLPKSFTFQGITLSWCNNKNTESGFFGTNSLNSVQITTNDDFGRYLYIYGLRQEGYEPPEIFDKDLIITLTKSQVVAAIANPDKCLLMLFLNVSLQRANLVNILRYDISFNIGSGDTLLNPIDIRNILPVGIPRELADCGGRLFLTILLIIFKWSLIFNVLYKHLSLVIGVSARPRRLFSNSILLYR